MKHIKIYTTGKMKGTTLTNQVEWRLKFERELRELSMGRTDLIFIHPPFYYNYDNPSHRNEREVKDWELAQVADSDIVVVNLDGINDSVGSHFEIAAAEAVNRMTSKNIYIIGIGTEDNLHPWIAESLLRREDDIKSAATYINAFLLD